MGFAGNLRTLSLPEVVQTLNRIKAEGVLRIASQLGTRDVVFAQGEIVGVGDRDGGDHRLMLRRLALMGHVRAPTDDELDTADTVISNLVELGTVPQEVINDMAQDQALETLFDLNNWTTADFLFHEAAESDEFSQAVEAARALGLAINVNSVLMEAARRHDEWDLIKDIFHDHDVPVAMLGQDDETAQQIAGTFPGNLLIPLIDGTRSCADLIYETGLTRFTVFSQLAGMQEDGVLRLLTVEEMHDRAEALAIDGREGDAARLFRHILAAKPEDSAAVTALASCLAGLGDHREAADCHAQLALAHLNKDRLQDAYEDANRAVDLDGNDPHIRGILVRCLVALGNVEQASEHLDVQARQFEKAGLIEEARDTWRKVLELRPDDDSTRHSLAAIQVKQSPGANDVVVCLECGAINPRSRDTCQQCEAKLSLSCMVCQKSVSVSDRICIFCGANPHLPPDQQAPIRSGPSTERVEAQAKVSTEAQQKGSNYWRAELRKLLDEARELEETGKVDAALEKWRELAKLQQNNVDLQKHIRELEGVIHDRFVEREIARGHDYKRGRKYWRALRCYRASLRSMGEEDLRAPRLREIIATTSRSHYRIMAIYGVAFLVIAATGFLAVKPYLDVSTIEKGSLAIESRLQVVVDADALRSSNAEHALLAARAEGLRGAHRSRADEALGRATGSIRQGTVTVLEAAFAQSRDRLAANDPAGARSAIAPLQDLFDDHYRQRAAQIETEAQALDTAIAAAAARQEEAPNRLKEAEAAEADLRLGEALATYQAVAKLNGPAAESAAKAVARLEPKYQAFLAQVRGVGEASREDLDRAIRDLAALATAAGHWGLADQHGKLVADLDARRRAATAAWAKLADGAAIADLEAFLAQHAGASESALARARVAQFRATQRQREAAIERYRGAMQEKTYEVAWQLALNLHQQYPGDLPPGAAPFPLVIVTKPEGAEVRRGETVLGMTPLVVTYEGAQATQPLTITAAGYERATLVPAELGSWQANLALDRAAIFRVALVNPARALVPGGEGLLVAVSAAGSEAVAIADGAGRWRVDLGEAALNVDRNTPVMPPVRLKDGTVVVAGVGTAVSVIAPDGKLRQRVPIEGTLRSQPLIYHNDLLGRDLRLAVVGGRLVHGPLGGTIAEAKWGVDTLAGCVAIPFDLDRLLVVGDLQGRLAAMEESSGRTVWTTDIGATEIGPFVPVAADQIAFILDGSRLASWRIRTDGATEAWSRALGGQPAGQPQVHQGTVHLPVGQAVLRTSAGGSDLPSLHLPSPATTAMQIAADGMGVVGCASHVAVFNGDALAWTSPLPAPAVAVTLAGGRVFVALSDGSLFAYQM